MHGGHGEPAKTEQGSGLDRASRKELFGCWLEEARGEGREPPGALVGAGPRGEGLWWGEGPSGTWG